uniref:SFRICE_019895 n=1 Tax=Spodoptera frugiperda TaxID=7108 RepID=A0A2H1W1N1_SPOFR
MKRESVAFQSPELRTAKRLIEAPARKAETEKENIVRNLKLTAFLEDFEYMQSSYIAYSGEKTVRRPIVPRYVLGVIGQGPMFSCIVNRTVFH